MRRGMDDGERPTMADVSHANPRTGDTLGDVFRRGPAVADGGVADDPRDDGGVADDPRDDGGVAEEDDEPEKMADVDHTPRNEDVNDVWDRGVESAAADDDGGDDV